MSCPVCLNGFTDPVILPCGHSLCNGECSKNLIRDNRITCPQCRSTHWIPDGEELPKNYDLRNIIQHNKQPVMCEKHPGDIIVMFCIDCYVPVCVRCYVNFGITGNTEVTEASHKEHKTIPLEKLNTHVKELLSLTTAYLQSKQQEEIHYLQELIDTNETVQEVIDGKCELVMRVTEKLKTYLDEKSKMQINTLRSIPISVSEQLPAINDVSRLTVRKLQKYDELRAQCEELGKKQCISSEDAIEIKRFINGLNELPDIGERPDPQTYLQSCLTEFKFGDVSQAVNAIHECYNSPQIEIPREPFIDLEDCVANTESVSISWRYAATDEVSYFTVYYCTAIFSVGKCSDMTSVIVSDFGRSTGHVTLRNLEPETRYRFYITSSNELGESPRSKYLYVKTSGCNTEMMLF